MQSDEVGGNMKSSLFAVFISSVLFSVLVLPDRLAAQNEAEHGHRHTFYVVKRLSTLDRKSVV